MSSKVILVVSKKITRTAVARNRLKRRTRAIIREIEAKLGPRERKIYFKAGDDKLSYKDLKSKIHDLLHIS